MFIHLFVLIKFNKKISKLHMLRYSIKIAIVHRNLSLLQGVTYAKFTLLYETYFIYDKQLCIC